MAVNCIIPALFILIYIVGCSRKGGGAIDPSIGISVVCDEMTKDSLSGSVKLHLIIKNITDDQITGYWGPTITGKNSLNRRMKADGFGVSISVNGSDDLPSEISTQHHISKELVEKFHLSPSESTEIDCIANFRNQEDMDFLLKSSDVRIKIEFRKNDLLPTDLYGLIVIPYEVRTP